MWPKYNSTLPNIKIDLDKKVGPKNRTCLSWVINVTACLESKQTIHLCPQILQFWRENSKFITWSHMFLIDDSVSKYLTYAVMCWKTIFYRLQYEKKGGQFSRDWQGGSRSPPPPRLWLTLSAHLRLLPSSKKIIEVYVSFCNSSSEITVRPRFCFSLLTVFLPFSSLILGQFWTYLS